MVSKRRDTTPERENDLRYQARRDPRVPVDSTTLLRQHNWYSIEIKVRDVSTRGFMAECNDPVRIGSYVSLDVPGMGPVHAQVRWQIGNRMGGMFLDPISLHRCEWAAERAESAETA
jgi:hypothetical protein